eukprot:CAMPEP_0179089576 /NCGR_PEP_ID=MMETSP0796-20121207/40823_1 /TAXON_ID=73915 /ORGANISM="Pyrodinium bahamense, Strain pbaha01" /LENGTH=226 /DNA_ID=CAMNT_0020787135 /DNA_START=55 /DNA_END=735 /DNA_ORIENTATION=+
MAPATPLLRAAGRGLHRPAITARRLPTVALGPRSLLAPAAGIPWAPLCCGCPLAAAFCTAGSAPGVEELEKQIEALKEQIVEVEEKHANVRLELQHQVKRHEKDLDSETEYGITKFAKALLQIPDNLERASSSLNQEDLEQDPELRRMRDNVAHAHGIVREAFEYFGIVKMECLDTPFNPEFHEAMFAMPMPDKQPNTIFHVMETGYLIRARTLRAAKVGIVRGPN